jgi:hypothetical protein
MQRAPAFSVCAANRKGGGNVCTPCAPQLPPEIYKRRLKKGLFRSRAFCRASLRFILL